MNYAKDRRRKRNGAEGDVIGCETLPEGMRRLIERRELLKGRRKVIKEKGLDARDRGMKGVVESIL